MSFSGVPSRGVRKAHLEPVFQGQDVELEELLVGVVEPLGAVRGDHDQPEAQQEPSHQEASPRRVVEAPARPIAVHEASTFAGQRRATGHHGLRTNRAPAQFA